ncbi:signal peptidase I [Microbacterium hatanonis]|uniref:Signal peptidase I n=1 Tax=Microbacterium hatanonis TaxID=404366 RepID=A0A5C8I2M1_9MICO|nr:signal peptidase I [Microbacterium hatanonis]TXK12589.1 signal peptidase I [Microbacterium hatanonis]
MPSPTEAPARGPAHQARVRGPVAAHAAADVRRRGAVRDGVITVLGVVGILTIVWLAASAALGLSIIVFVTGSMSPSLPTGSAAVVREVPASELAVGDVVTVPRPNSPAPVTHRIVAIDDVPGNVDARSLVLRGDANTIDDPDPYVVEDVRRVVVGAPGAGWVVIAAKTPAAMAGITLVVAGAIAWALWPASSPRRAREK